MEANALFRAMRARDERQALSVLRAHPELAHTRDDDGLSALMLALYHGFRELAHALQREPGDLDLFEAAAVGDVRRLRELVTDRAAANTWSSDGFSLLHLAAFFGQPEAVRFLVAQGADIEAVARNQRLAAEARPLHSAVAAQERDVITALLDAGADPNSRQHGGYTPLLEAAQLGNVKLVDLLLAHGASASDRLGDGSSASDLARKAGNERLAERLEKAAAQRRA
jgi:ankyrin repeat protein